MLLMRAWAWGDITTHAVGLQRQVDVVDIAAAAGDETGVLKPGYRLADTEFLPTRSSLEDGSEAAAHMRRRTARLPRLICLILTIAGNENGRGCPWLKARRPPIRPRHRSNAAGGELFGHPRGPRLPLHHRNVGALLLLRDARAARSLHDQISAAARPGRQRRRAWRAQERAGSVFGPLDVQPLSSQIYGFYTALVYLTPIFGGLLADRVLGQRRMVIDRRDPDGDRPFHDGGRVSFSCLRCSRSSSATALSSRISPRRSAVFMRPATIAATALIRSFMSASISARFWRRWFAARLARRRAGITALPPPASAC